MAAERTEKSGKGGKGTQGWRIRVRCVGDITRRAGWRCGQGLGGGGTSCEWAVRMCIEDICAGMGSREQGRGGVEALDVWCGEGEVGIQFL